MRWPNEESYPDTVEAMRTLLPCVDEATRLSPRLRTHVQAMISTPLLSFTAVGYGTGEKFPIPGEETGPADPSGTNRDPYVMRYIADSLSYSAHNPVNQVCMLTY